MCIRDRLYYDFAGDPEYYSSHSAIMLNVIQSQYGTNVCLVVVNLSKDTKVIHEELGYWLSFISYHNRNIRNRCKVVVIGSHTDVVTAADVKMKVKSISQFASEYSSKSSKATFQVGEVLTLNCRQPRLSQSVRDILFQISKYASPCHLSLEAAILLGLLEKDFNNVVTCKLQNLLSHIQETGLCLPTAAESLYPIIQQLHNIGLLMTIGRHCDKLEDHLLLLNISKLTNEVHKLLFSNSAIDKSLHASMGVLSQSYLNGILPEHINTDCLVQLQYCQPFSHVEVKFDYLTPTEDSSSPTLFYFPALCTVDKKEGIEGTDDFKYYIGSVSYTHLTLPTIYSV